MVPDRQKVRTDGRTEGRTEWTDGQTDGRTDDAKTISLRLRRGIIIRLLIVKLLLDMKSLYSKVTRIGQVLKTNSQGVKILIFPYQSVKACTCFWSS